MLDQEIIGDGGYTDANGVYHTGAKIDPNNVQMGGNAEQKLEDSYNAEQISIPFTAKITDNGTALNVSSPNNTLAFTVNFNGCSECFTPFFSASKIGGQDVQIRMKYYHKIITVSGIFTSCQVNGVLHNIILPSMKLHVFLGWEWDSANNVKTNYKLVITPSNDYFNTKVTEDFSTVTLPDCSQLINDMCASVDQQRGVGVLSKWITSYNSSYTPFLREMYVHFASCVHLWQNMAPNLQRDENNFFYTWIPLWSINFGNSTDFAVSTDKNTGKKYLDLDVVSAFLTISDENSFVTNFGWGPYSSEEQRLISQLGISSDTIRTDLQTCAIMDYTKLIINPFTFYSENKYRKGCLIGAKPAAGLIYDAEEMVFPRDISTNLFYYKGVGDSKDISNPKIKHKDEIIIINARKMYSEPSHIDQKPIDSALRLDFAALENTDVILTSRIEGNEETISRFFDEVHVFVNDNLEYSRELTNGYKECRYTDAHSEGLQWKLYQLKEGIKFYTTDGFELPLIQSVGDIRNENVIKVPGKLSISLSGLIFQQQCRYGVEFDNIDNVLFDQRVFRGEVFGINSPTNAENIRSEIKNRFGLLRIGQVDPNGTAVPSAFINGQVNTNTNYYLIKRSMSDLENPTYAFGGSEYYNDFYEMKINKNAANKWKTYSQKSQFSKLLVYPDYNPSSERKNCWYSIFKSRRNNCFKGNYFRRNFNRISWNSGSYL